MMIGVVEVSGDALRALAHDPAFAAELEALSVRSAEINPFYEPWMLLPALRLLSCADVRLLTVRDGRRLIGVLPLRRVRHPRVPVAVLALWRHPYCFCCAPLIDRGEIERCAAAVGAWLESNAASARVLEFHSYDAEGFFGREFVPRLLGRRGWVHDALPAQRALLRTGTDWQVGISHKHAKELRRLENRLREQGTVDYAVMPSDADCTPWIDGFLALEAAGWKGREATALASAAQDREYFSTVARSAHTRSRLQLMALRLDGVPIAMKCNFLAPPGAFAFKIAYDERHAKYSPGLLLEIFNMKVLAGRPDIAWMDSCADPGHPMIERLWPDRRNLGWIMASGRGWLGRAAILAAPRYRGLKRLLQRRRAPQPRVAQTEPAA